MTDPQIARAAQLPDKHRYLGVPNPVGGRIWDAASRLSADWMERHGHPVGFVLGAVTSPSRHYPG